MSSRRHWVSRVIVGALTVALVATACGGDDSESAGGSDGGVFRLGISEPVSIDPYNSQESEGQLITKNIFAGLVTVDSEQQLAPAVAEKWTRNDECTEWTFNLRKGTKFTNGEEVTAQSFIDGINRAVQQEAASDIAYHADVIAGFEDVNGSVDDKGDPVPAKADKLSGLSAPDPYTLKIALSAPTCEFDKRAVQPMFSPVPSTAGAFDNQAFNDSPIGNGPFKMKEPWKHDESITLVRNDDYFGTKASLSEVQFTIESVEDEYKNFQAGARDWARIPNELTAQAKASYEKDGKFLSFASFGLTFLLPNNANAPLANADARKAISAAIDRQKVIDGVFKAPLEKADSVVPSAFTEYYKKGQCEACEFNVSKAKDWATKGGLNANTTVTFTYSEDSGNQAAVEAIAAQIRTNLGIKVELKPLAKFRDLLGALSDEKASGLFQAAWSADYPTPLTFLQPLLLSTSFDNRGQYANPKFDDQVEKAGEAKDDSARKSPVQAADKIALDDMALIPLWYRTQFRVWDASKWTGVKADFFENPTLATIKAK